MANSPSTIIYSSYRLLRHRDFDGWQFIYAVDVIVQQTCFQKGNSPYERSTEAPLWLATSFWMCTKREGIQNLGNEPVSSSELHLIPLIENLE